MIVAACTFLAASAQHPMVTLSHNGELSFFTNLGAFEDALTAAEDNDIIYLSEGNFSSQYTDVVITKRIRIVGSGYNSQLLFGIKVNMINNPYENGQMLSFDGVNILKLDFQGPSTVSDHPTNRKNIGLVKITNSFIETLDGVGIAGDELTIEKCYIKDLIPYAVSQNLTIIKNSKILRILNQNYDSSGAYMTLENCNVWGSYYLPTTVISSIIQYPLDSKGIGNKLSKFSGSNGHISLINSLFYSENQFPTNYTISQNNCFYDEREEEFFDEKLESIFNLEESGYFGQDGKVIGIMGGETPFSENPSVPTVDSANSSVKYDAENNKLKVSITVKAD